ncbi:pyocin knob domain-containing protein [Bacillus thuringiensis]|uniref:pyocin knob domain-containing protein n=2 Tax=Bacillus TaxID=1386 RepID=UPI00040AE338|nr:pyocin knob domain-containing protein [Bacillus thuringiensis]
MSDKTIESTNEFTIIQKAIEAGEKLEGVDINGIIAAGAKADAALPKTGGTMKGTTIFEAGDLRFKNAANDILFRNNASGIFSLYDIAQNQVVWTYNPTTKEFIVTAASNLLKKTDIYPNWVTPTGNAVQLPTGTDLNTVVSPGIYGGSNFVNSPDGGTDAAYIEVWTYGNYVYQKFISMTGSNRRSFVRRKSVSTWGGWQKEILEDGGIMTGDIDIKKNIPGMSFTIADGSKSAKLLYNAGPGTDYGFCIMTPTGKAYLRTTGESATREIATKEKDGKATLTLTADATPGSSNPQIATRRGNTVTIWLDAIRNADSTNPIITTIPEGMRPTDSINYTGVSTDGTLSRILFRFNGEVHFADNTAKGKRFNIAFTYVVD